MEGECASDRHAPGGRAALWLGRGGVNVGNMALGIVPLMPQLGPQVITHSLTL